MKTITLTKEVAIEILRNMHPNQRELNWEKVYTYQRHMDYGLFEAQQWPPIEFCDKNRLTNGQHRIMAFLLSSLTSVRFNYFSAAASQPFITPDD